MKFSNFEFAVVSIEQTDLKHLAHKPDYAVVVKYLMQGIHYIIAS